MGLIEESEAFLAISLEDPDLFGWPLILKNPAGQVQGLDPDDELYCQARHINMLIDMETGTDVQSEQASVTVRLSSVTIGEPAKKWTGSVTDTAGNIFNFYVVEAMPDYTLGIVVLKLGKLES